MKTFLKNLKIFIFGESEEDIQEKFYENHKRRMGRTKKVRKK